MRLTSVALTDFRNYENLELELSPSTTVIVGPNGSGKTNLVEAIGWLATGASFRGAPDDALVRMDAEQAIIRALGERSERALQIEVEINRHGRNRVQVNRQRLARVSDLADSLAVTVFSPDDLELIKGGPAHRRQLLDRTLAVLHARHRSSQADVARVLKQRNTLLRQAGGRLDAEIASTLDVWDAKLAECGTALIRARRGLAEAMVGPVQAAYDTLAGSESRVAMNYRSAHGDGELADALVDHRDDDLRRGTTTVGPHRDELELALGELPARTHCSQGEQRTLALALRLSAHRLVTERLETTPLLILDDVFSELDGDRARALVEQIPVGQVLMTTAAPVPVDETNARIVAVEDLSMAAR